MRISIIGAGSLGTLFGGLLADSGHDVWLHHYREAYVEEIERNGVRIDSEILDEVIEVDINATTDASEVGTVDVAFVFVKAHQTREAVSQHVDCIGPDTTVVSLQNGLINRQMLSEFVDPEQILTGVTLQGGTRIDPGVVEHTFSGPTKFGGPDEEAAARVAEALEAARVPDVRVVEDPQQHIWQKQIEDIGLKPIAALTRLTCGGVVAEDEIVDVMDKVIEEARTVAEAKDIHIDSDDVTADVVESLTDSPHRSSMLQDVLAERKTEVDHINGAVVELADEEDIKVPYNETMVSLVHGLERSYIE